MNPCAVQSLANNFNMPPITASSCPTSSQSDPTPSSLPISCGEPSSSVPSRALTRPLSPVTRSPSPQAKRLRRSLPPCASSSSILNDINPNTNSHYCHCHYCYHFRNNNNNNNNNNHIANTHHDHIRSTSTDSIPRDNDTSSPTSISGNSKSNKESDQHGELSSSSHESAAQLHTLSVLAQRDIDHAKQLRGYYDKIMFSVITPNMREQLVGWSADLADDLKLPSALAATTVNLFDRFITLRSVSTPVLHAVAAACLLVAFKTLSDDDPPLRLIARRARVTVANMLAIETVLLNVLQWRVAVVTPHEVIAQLTNAAMVDTRRCVCCEPQRQLSTHSTPNPMDDGLPSKSVVGDNGEDHYMCPQCVEDTSANSLTEKERLLSHAMHDALLMHALMDCRTASMRATSVGVACLLVTEAARNGLPLAEVDCLQISPLYSIAKQSGVSMTEVDYCADILLAVVATLFEDVEDADSDQSE